MKKFEKRPRVLRYVLRDRATKGCDFLLWGDDDPEAARVSLQSARDNDGLDVELVVMFADDMDPLTDQLINGRK